MLDTISRGYKHFSRRSGAEEVATLLQKGAMTRVSTSEQQAGFYSIYFLVPKKDDGLCPILDLRHLNAHLKTLTFKMLQTRHILESIEPGEWFTMIDLKDAYFHVPICQEHQPFPRFAFQGQAYRFQVLPFGLSLSPRVFTRVVAAALAPLQRRGLRIMPYHWLVCAPSRQQVVEDTESVLSHIQSLGFQVNSKKSDLNPRQETSFLGLCLNSLTMRASLTPQRVAGIQATLRAFRQNRRIELLYFQRMLGLMSAAAMVVPLGLLRAQPLQCWLNAFGLHPRRYRHRKLRVTQLCLQALLPWWNVSWLTEGVPLGRVPSRRTLVSTDASQTGWGATWEGRTVRGRWEHLWDKEHINVLELRAIHLGLRALLPFIQGKHVLVRTDNRSAVYHVNHQGGTRSRRCLKIAQGLLFWAFPRLTSLRAVHVPGVLNQAADLLSRSGPPPGEWRLHAEVVANLWARFGVAQVDLFASRETTHCQMWFSLSYPTGAGCTVSRVARRNIVRFPSNTLDSTGTGEITPGLLPSAVSGSTLASETFPALLRLVHGQPWPLPVRADLLSQVGGRIWHPRPAVLQLWAWPLLSPCLKG